MTSIKNIVVFFCCLICACSLFKKSGVETESDFIAFSLKQAQQQLQAGKMTGEIGKLGGMTRIIGAVIDEKGDDIILVGRAVPGLPAAGFDDLVTALRARLVYDELPMISIDPTPNSNTTGIQKVSYGGHIENTAWGNDFFQCDVILKKYGMGMLSLLKDVPSYKSRCTDYIVKQLNDAGIQVNRQSWVPYDSIKSYDGKSKNSEEVFQSKFWFNYFDPYRVRIRGGVFCIMSLDICFLYHTSQNEGRKTAASDSANINKPEVQFTKSLTDNYKALCDSFPVLKRIKVLFDLAAVAEGLKGMGKIPDINYLKHDYKLNPVSTPSEFEYIRQYGIFDRSDGKTQLVQICGGIEPVPELEWLNAGDVSYLKSVVLRARPSSGAVSWKLPLSQWNMPNAGGIITSNNTTADRKGSVITMNSVSIDRNAASRVSQTSFNGFAAAAPPKPIEYKGVAMKMIIDNGNFKSDPKNDSLSDAILKKFAR